MKIGNRLNLTASFLSRQYMSDTTNHDLMKNLHEPLSNLLFDNLYWNMFREFLVE